MILIVALFVCVIALSIMLLYLLEWSNKADRELDMLGNLAKKYDSRLNSLERITFDIETEIRQEVYKQINKRELEKIYFNGK